jgi:ketosteroid isomerase-like protein
MNIAQASTPTGLSSPTRGYAAIVNKDSATLNRLYADDYMRIGNAGDVRDKAQAIKSLVGSDWTVTHTEQSDLIVRLYGDVAVVRGISTFTGMNKGESPRNYKGRFTQVWVKRSGGWQMTLQQRTTIERT